MLHRSLVSMAGLSRLLSAHVGLNHFVLAGARYTVFCSMPFLTNSILKRKEDLRSTATCIDERAKAQAVSSTPSRLVLQPWKVLSVRYHATTKNHLGSIHPEQA